jgi:hypothetical protein
MRHHLTSLHESIWDIVEFGAHVPQVGDEDYDSDKAAQIRHFNSQATSILLTSLCRVEYNKVQGLKNTKEIWDVLKTAHEGDEVTKITKRETIKGELGPFVLNKGEEPQAKYNRLKTMVNQVRNLGSTKWDDHEMVKVIYRSLVFRNPTQVQLIHGDPRYKQMSPEEVIGKFVSFELMIKDSKHIVNLEQGATSTHEVQPIAFKATEEKKEESTPSMLPIDVSKLDNAEMALIIKSFRQILKQRKGKDYKPRSKRVSYRCGRFGHFIARCPYSSESDRDEDKKGKKKEKKKSILPIKAVRGRLPPLVLPSANLHRPSICVKSSPSVSSPPLQASSIPRSQLLLSLLPSSSTAGFIRAVIGNGSGLPTPPSTSPTPPPLALWRFGWPQSPRSRCL